MKPDELIVVGRIVAPHGVRGDLRILPDTDRPEIFKTLKRLKIGGKFYKLLRDVRIRMYTFFMWKVWTTGIWPKR